MLSIASRISISIHLHVRHTEFTFRDCFIPLLTHKFRRSLEPSINPTGNRRTVLKPAGNLLLGFSGGLGSTSLLDLVHRCYYSEDGKLSNQHKVGKDQSRNSVWKKVSVCFVEVFEAYPEVSTVAHIPHLSLIF